MTRRPRYIARALARFSLADGHDDDEGDADADGGSGSDATTSLTDVFSYVRAGERAAS